jgi:hypothetical protein
MTEVLDASKGNYQVSAPVRILKYNEHCAGDKGTPQACRI